ncbi:MAG: Yip1 family protein [Lysobacter sp.]
MNLEKLIARVKSILLSPRTTWPEIGAEPATIPGLYTGYIMILAALPAVFGFIKSSVIGHSLFGATIRTGLFTGLTAMVLTYVLSLVLVYVVAWIVNALAPSFGGQKNQVQALKVIAYAYTAAWVAGIAAILPWVGGLIGLLAAIYSIYLLYLGLPHTMKNPAEKSLGYTAVIVIITIVLALIIGAVVAGITGVGALATGATGSRVSTSDVRFDKDSKLGQLAAFGEQMAAAGEQMEAEQAKARARGEDTGSDAQSAEAALATLFGGKDGKPLESLEPEQLKAFLPDSLGSLPRTAISASRESGMGMQITNASADYANEDGSQRIAIKLVDTPMLARAGALTQLMRSESSSEDADGYEKSYSRNGRQIEEKWNRSSGRGSYAVVVGSRFSVRAEGRADSFEQIQRAAESVDLAAFEKLAAANR